MMLDISAPPSVSFNQILIYTCTVRVDGDDRSADLASTAARPHGATQLLYRTAVIAILIR